MIRLKKLQQAKAEAAKLNKSNANNNSQTDSINTSVAFMRAKKDLQEYEDIPSVTVSYDRDDPMHIRLTITPDGGYYYGGKFHFECTVPKEFPNSAPEFRCLEKIYHPNIDIQGHVCLNILRNDWKPTLSLQLVFAGILHLFLQPNPNDPLNKDAANDLAKYPQQFANHVRMAMSGGYVGNEKFEPVIISMNRSANRSTGLYGGSYNHGY